MTLTIPSLLYAGIICLLFYNVRRGLRLPLLVVASFAYAWYLAPYAAVAVLVTSAAAWLLGLLEAAARKRENQKLTRILAGIGIGLCVLSLLVMKDLPLVRPSILDAHPILGGVLMPLGFSFYLFQVISYLADVATGKTEAVRSPWKVFLMLAWFPKFVSGPIERTEGFRQQIDRLDAVDVFSTVRWKYVLHYCLVGMFLKLVIADRFAMSVDTIFENYAGFSTVWLLIGAILYSFQIYADFAGYSYVAVGVSLAFGLQLSENFNLPYQAENITDFWRRWHISLSSFLRDYVYIPLGGNRKGPARKALNTMIVFLLCGAWHGAGLQFIVWGALHGLYSWLDGVLRGRNIRFLREGIIGRILTFMGVTFAWIFFRAKDLTSAIGYLRTFLTAGPRWHSFAAEAEVLNIDPIEGWIIGILILWVLFWEAFAGRKATCIPKLTAAWHYVPRYIFIFIVLFAILILGIYGGSFQGGNMIYMQF